MRTSCRTCLAFVAASLAVTAINAVPARANVNNTTRLVMDEAAAPVSELKLSTVSLRREVVEPNTETFTRTAARRKRTARRRTFRTSRPKRVTIKRKHPRETDPPRAVGTYFGAVQTIINPVY